MTKPAARPDSHATPLNTYLAEALRLAKNTAQGEYDRLTRNAIQLQAQLKEAKAKQRKAKRAVKFARLAWIDAVEGGL